MWIVHVAEPHFGRSLATGCRPPPSRPLGGCRKTLPSHSAGAAKSPRCQSQPWRVGCGCWQAEAALPFFKKALEVNPKVEQFWVSYADGFLRTQQPDAARRIIEQARQHGISEEGLSTIAERIRASPSLDEQEQLIELFKQKRFAEMEACARDLIHRFPEDAFGWATLALALKNPLEYSKANEAYREALRLAPNSAMILSNFANHLNDQGDYQASAEHASRAIQIDNTNVGAWLNRGNALAGMGDDEGAATCFREALRIDPNLPQAHNNLGGILQRGNLHLEAEACFRRALALWPEFAGARFNLAGILAYQGLVGEAESHFEQAICREPDFANLFLQKLLLPIIPKSSSAIAHWRKRYTTGIAQLAGLADALDDPSDLTKKLDARTFNLAYHDADDRPIMEALCRLFRAKSPALNFTAPHIVGWQPPDGYSGRRIRIGMLSEFLVGHTIGKLYQGFLRYLDRSCFEVVLIHAPKAKHDAFSAEFDKWVDRALKLPPSLAAQQKMLAELELDVLFYPEIGMSHATYFLAFARLAKVQIVSWGHPDTTGLDTMDYFVSADSIEPDNAEVHYSERLIRMNRLPCFYQPLVVPTQIPARTALGLPETGTLYGCPQSLFKFHPEFDAILAAIAVGDPEGHIVVLEGKVPTWGRLLRERWGESEPILNERVIFLPQQPQDRFMGLMAHFDVLLDPIHFGSGNTLYEAMVYGKPIVTWPGRFMRGRIVAGAYQQMGLMDAPIAERLEDYAPLALALGGDIARRTRLREALIQGAKALFADQQAVRELETFVLAALQTAANGEKLPSGWSPPLEIDKPDSKMMCDS